MVENSRLEHNADVLRLHVFTRGVQEPSLVEVTSSAQVAFKHSFLHVAAFLLLVVALFAQHHFGGGRSIFIRNVHNVLLVRLGSIFCSVEEVF